MEKYLLLWHPSNYPEDACIKPWIVDSDFFTDERGYDDDDRAGIDELNVGNTEYLGLGDHQVIRLPDDCQIIDMTNNLEFVVVATNQYEPARSYSRGGFKCRADACKYMSYLAKEEIESDGYSRYDDDEDLSQYDQVMTDSYEFTILSQIPVR